MNALEIKLIAGMVMLLATTGAYIVGFKMGFNCALKNAKRTLMGGWEREQKMRQLIDSISDQVLNFKSQLDMQAIPENSPARQMQIDPQSFKLANELGYETMFGIKLLKGGR